MKSSYVKFIQKLEINRVDCENINLEEWGKETNCIIVNSTGLRLEVVTSSFLRRFSSAFVKAYKLIKSGQLVTFVDDTEDLFLNFAQILEVIDLNFVIRTWAKVQFKTIIFPFCNKNGDQFIAKYTWKEGSFFLRIEKYPDLVELMVFTEGNVYNSKHNIIFVVPED